MAMVTMNFALYQALIGKSDEIWTFSHHNLIKELNSHKKDNMRLYETK